MATQSVVTRGSGDDAWDTETKNREKTNAGEMLAILERELK